MPRVGGIYSLPVGYHADPGTTIRSSQHNEPLEDIAQALTESLPRDGSAPMTGPLTLSANPTADMQAVPRQYAVAKAGDEMTGALSIQYENPSFSLKSSAVTDPRMAKFNFTIAPDTGTFSLDTQNRDTGEYISNAYRIENGVSGPTRHIFGIAGTWAAEIHPPASGLVNANTIVTRQTGDARYVRASDFVNAGWPVGSIELSLSTSGTANPNNRFPGTTWVQIAQGKAIVGVGTADGVTWTAGQTRGKANETLTIAQIPSHAHSGSVDSGGFHGHGAGIGNGLTNGTGFTVRGFSESRQIITSAWGYASTSLTSSTTGIGDTSGSVTAQKLSLNLSHSHSININWGGEHNHGMTINANGGGGSHNNIQPSIALYIWQRTA